MYNSSELGICHKQHWLLAQKPLLFSLLVGKAHLQFTEATNAMCWLSQCSLRERGTQFCPVASEKNFASVFFCCCFSSFFLFCF